MRICICIPVFDDWVAAAELLSRLDQMAAALADETDVLLVDDGSPSGPARIETPLAGLRRVSLLRLRRNLGHQRAISIGLTYLYAERSYDAVVVMDGDGEDPPEAVPALIARCREAEFERAIFAQRTKRAEGFAFRAGYVIFKLLHRALTGRRVEVGNFSIIPAVILARLVAVSELWNHYAAAVFHARLPIEMIPIRRARRIAGNSKMNVIALVAHGLSAISVYGDIVGVRLLGMTAFACGCSLLGMLAVVAARFGTDLAIPGWATSALGLLVVLFVNLVGLGLAAALSTLRARAQTSFLPLRDYSYYVLEASDLSERAR